MGLLQMPILNVVLASGVLKELDESSNRGRIGCLSSGGMDRSTDYRMGPLVRRRNWDTQPRPNGRSSPFMASNWVATARTIEWVGGIAR
ncbi:predicted protein [Pyrenophora tritici-repentis Pt-1C-BFP]|uniref:Uncharacterized protein n=1 Tax=Pyrenophora tritici-repentis (strain Pt-1C-BFP) TaxID=426418 RepID=B2WPA9_PYRTR|nr:uncharacterized protein PTRG_11819 [Pyrenophora tritici-repentis Pt-1C-BFP]XP_001942166.1 uncharacterized protein PTRG_11835 [Pyrenophora tritici-repentis Pt-1C-BFP]XP_001942402.1 uncharacterized protein PTRG_12079 [Pyrenophora tritici-repentis Pt-1C-BFP]EDU45975.1 predicted protein [Pyrenophora tritici-repentis Pt-1C-BFP]EDU45991.1 predicted protein [Pyrenophora tritici-repentis Pt-1C-BFP]EDU46227.1 predicted protein [Pyrenophora tritici-repentis Pt-1C-BFP]